MIKRVARHLSTRAQAPFFSWFKKKPQPVEDTTPKKDEWDPKNWTHMGPVLQDIKRANQNKPKLLPLQRDDQRQKLTVVVELDEVLIYTFAPDPRENWMTAPIRRWDFSVELPEFETWIDIFKREHLDTFLEYWMTECEPVLWSQGHPAYVKRAMKEICPHFPESHILTQEHCNLVEFPEETIEMFLKDGDRLGRDPKRLVYVDSKPFNFWGFGDNSLPTSVFTADNTDVHSKDDLLKLITELKTLSHESDVRKALGKRYKIEQLQRECKLIL